MSTAKPDGKTRTDLSRTSVSGLHANLEVAFVGKKLVIGRGSDCDVSVPDRRVSHRHAIMYRVGDTFVIRDLDSRNGTFVNGKRVREHTLCPDDEIVVGKTKLRVEALLSDDHLAESIKIKIPLAGLEDDASPAQSVDPDPDLAERLSLLHRLVVALAEDRGEAVTRRLAQLARRLVGADEVTVYGIEDGEPVARARHAATERPAGGSAPPEAMLGEAVRRGRPVLQTVRSEASDQTGGCSVSFPLRSGDEVVGVLHLERASGESFSEADLHVLALLCNHAAALIARAGERAELRSLAAALAAEREARNQDQDDHRETLEEVRSDLGGIQRFLSVAQREVSGATIGEQALNALRLAQRIAGRCADRLAEAPAKNETDPG